MEPGCSQFACHDHLGLVRVDGAALLEQLDCGLDTVKDDDGLAEHSDVYEV